MLSHAICISSVHPGKGQEARAFGEEDEAFAFWATSFIFLRTTLGLETNFPNFQSWSREGEGTRKAEFRRGLENRVQVRLENRGAEEEPGGLQKERG